MEELRNMTTEEKNEIIANNLLLAFYCSGLHQLGDSIDQIMETEKVKEANLTRTQVENLIFNVGPNLALCLG